MKIIAQDSTPRSIPLTVSNRDARGEALKKHAKLARRVVEHIYGAEAFIKLEGVARDDYIALLSVPVDILVEYYLNQKPV